MALTRRSDSRTGSTYSPLHVTTWDNPQSFEVETAADWTMIDTDKVRIIHPVFLGTDIEVVLLA